MNQEDDPHAWRKEYMGMKVLSKMQLELLENGPKSLSQSWLVGAMHNDWKRKKGIKDPPVGKGTQTSLSEVLKRWG
tara:strand:+ start:134 stop:361 length:228 start_codon:yes stop_codon:yes gene_type:complete